MKHKIIWAISLVMIALFVGGVVNYSRKLQVTDTARMRTDEVSNPTQKKTPTQMSESAKKAPDVTVPSKIEVDLALSNAPPEVRDYILKYGVPPVPAPLGTPLIPVVFPFNDTFMTNYAYSVVWSNDVLIIRYFPNGPNHVSKTNGLLVLAPVIPPEGGVK